MFPEPVFAGLLAPEVVALPLAAGATFGVAGGVGRFMIPTEMVAIPPIIATAIGTVNTGFFHHGV